MTDHTRRMAHAGGGYSHFVKFMKVVLPLLAFGIIGLLAAGRASRAAISRPRGATAASWR